MRRVSSRQRLVSWDAFDATANPAEAASSSSSDEEECFNHESPQTPTLTSRKRERSTHSSTHPSSSKSPVAIAAALTSSVVLHQQKAQALQTPRNVPAFPWEFASSSSSSQQQQQQQQPMDSVPEDVYLYMCSFLDLASIRNVMTLNHKFRLLILSADSFWMSKCQTVWAGLMLSENNTKTNDNSQQQQQQQRLVDWSNIPIVGVEEDSNCKMTVNLPLLISMTPTQLPTQVDETMLGTCRRVHRTVFRRQHNREMQIIERTLTPDATQDQQQQQAELVIVMLDQQGNGSASSGTLKKKKSIQYTGRVGSGDRCIRSNHPMPRPSKGIITSTSTTTKNLKQRFALKDIGKQRLHASSSLFDLWCRGGAPKSAICGTPLLDMMEQHKPFCAPYLANDGVSLQVGPRMVAYFEVSILAATASSDKPTTTTAGGPHRDCVAVGVATESFSCQTRMPGWDAQSFGYHGDDGGTFHASGAMLERFGPCFGTGDTVGCGIDYVARGIFFTLNGVFLGYGWKQIDSEFLENKLYGVVGIDTNDPVSVNYGGDAPFQFDLRKFTSKHDKLIAQLYQHDTTPTTTQHYDHSNNQKKEEQVEDDRASELAALPSYPEI